MKSIFGYIPTKHECRMPSKREKHISLSCIFYLIFDTKIRSYNTIGQYKLKIKRIVFVSLSIRTESECQKILPFSYLLKLTISRKSMLTHGIYLPIILKGSTRKSTNNGKEYWGLTLPKSMLFLIEILLIVLLERDKLSTKR